VLDPYARAVLSRRNWGRLAPDLAWDAPGVLGFASTWPQAAAALPSMDDFDWEGAGCDAARGAQARTRLGVRMDVCVHESIRAGLCLVSAHKSSICAW